MDRRLKLKLQNTNVVDMNVIEKVNKFNDLRIKMERTPSSATFEQFMLRITNSNAIKTTANLLKSIQNLQLADHLSPMKRLGESPVTVKTFLSAFMIIGYSDDVFSTKGTEETILLESAKRMITTFENFCEKIINAEFDQELLGVFKQQHKRYIDVFDSWKSSDSDKLINVLSRSYYELTETKKLIQFQAMNEEREQREDEDIWCTEIDKQKEQILTQIRYIGGENAIEKLEDYKPTEAAVMHQREIYELAEKAYWDSFKEELDAEPPVYKRVLNMLNEIKERLKSYTPRRNDFKKQIDEEIDVSHIENMIKHDAFNTEELVTIVTFIIDRIKMLESPAENDSTEMWRECLVNKLENDIKFSDILPNIFKDIFRKLDKIESDISNFLKRVEGTSPLSSPRKKI